LTKYPDHNPSLSSNLNAHMDKRTLSGTVLILALVMLIESLATGISISYFPKYATSLGASVASLGVFMSSFMAAYAIMSPKMGGLSDSYGRKKLMMFGLAGDVIFGVAQGVAPNWVWLLIIRIINGAVASAAMISGQALLMDVANPKKRGEVSGMVMSMSMLGHLVGPLFGGIIQSLAITMGLGLITSYRVPYFVDSIFAVVALGLVAWKVPDLRGELDSSVHNIVDMHSGSSKSIHERGDVHDAPAEGSHGSMGMNGGHTTKEHVGEVTLSSSLKILLVFVFVNGLIEGVTMPLVVLFLGDKFLMPPVQIGMFLSVSGVVGFFATMYAGRLADRYGRKPFIVLGSLVSYLSSIFLPIVNMLMPALGLTALWCVADNTGSPALMALRTDLTEAENRGKIFGYFGTASMSGMIIGPVIGTYLYGTYQNVSISLFGISIPGYGMPFVVFGILGVAAALMVQLLIREPEERSADASMTFVH